MTEKMPEDDLDIRSGLNDPSGVRRMLVLDYYDGATEGLLEFGPRGNVYHFRMTQETHNPEGLDWRMFAFRPLPKDAYDRIEAVAAADPEITRSGTDQIDQILAEAGPALWQVETDNYHFFNRFTATRLICSSASEG